MFSSRCESWNRWVVWNSLELHRHNASPRGFSINGKRGALRKYQAECFFPSAGDDSHSLSMQCSSALLASKCFCYCPGEWTSPSGDQDLRNVTRIWVSWRNGEDNKLILKCMKRGGMYDGGAVELHRLRIMENGKWLVLSFLVLGSVFTPSPTAWLSPLSFQLWKVWQKRTNWRVLGREGKKRSRLLVSDLSL